MTALDEEIINNLTELELFRNNLPQSAELRFLATTSLRKTFGVITILFDESKDAVLLIPYIRNQSHQKGDILDMSEDPEHTAIRNLLEEAGVQALEVPEQIGTFSVPNTGKKSTDVLFHKYVMIVRRSNGPLRTDDQMLSEKNLPPIWVRRSLLHEIFEEQPLIEGKVRIHPQRIAYRQFMRQIEMERL